MATDVREMGDVPRLQMWRKLMPSPAKVAGTGIATKMETLIIQYHIPWDRSLVFPTIPQFVCPFFHRRPERTVTIDSTSIDQEEQGGGMDFKIKFSIPDGDKEDE